jgi:hypothetical protein
MIKLYFLPSRTSIESSGFQPGIWTINYIDKVYVCPTIPTIYHGIYHQ